LQYLHAIRCCCKSTPSTKRCVTPEHSASEIFVLTSDDTEDYVPQHADDDAVLSGTGDMVNQNEALPVFRNII